MTSWLNDYSLAIGERDRKEKAEKDLYNKCQQQEAQCFDSVDNSVNLDTRLAIRTAAYHPTPTEIENPARKDGSISAYSKFILDAKEQTPSVTNVDFLQQAIQDLGEAQRIRGTMELRLQQLADQTKKLFAQTKANGNRITELTLERTQLAAKLRDRDEELKGKAKLLVVSLQQPQCLT